MTSNEETMEVEESNVDSYGNKGKPRFSVRDPSKKVAQTKEMLSKQAVQTKEILSKQAVKIAKQAEEHERFINKVTHLLGVLGFGGFCFILGARPQDVRYLYCLFYVIFVPLRWIYYRYKKWHYYLLDFCYYANTIFLIMLLCYPKNEKLFMVCFSFAEGPLAWALIVWRCSLVFNSMDKIVSVFIHLLPGSILISCHHLLVYLLDDVPHLPYYHASEPYILVFYLEFSLPGLHFLERVGSRIGLLHDPMVGSGFFEAMHPEGTARRASWPYVESKSNLWTWLFFVPLLAYSIWQLLYFLIVNVLRRQRLLRDPEVMTSYRELSKKAQKANNVWWRLSGLLGDQNRLLMYILLQATFTVATMALTVPIFLSYELHVTFQILKVSATVWNGGNFLLEVMPRQVILKEKKKTANQENSIELDNSSELIQPPQ